MQATAVRADGLDVRTVQPGAASRADVAGGPRPFGLLDELGHLSIAGFRRLGRTPEESAVQVQRKISISKIRILRQAPRGRSSLDGLAGTADLRQLLVARAFRGQAGCQLQRAAGLRRNAPSPAEIATIVNLNAKQHF